jgi:hypothetical protein
MRHGEEHGEEPGSRATVVGNVLITSELQRRPQRAPDYEAESRAPIISC